MSWKLWNTKPTCSAHAGGARVFIQREQILPVQPHVPRVGVSSPAMMDSSVETREPEAPTMAAVSHVP